MPFAGLEPEGDERPILVQERRVSGLLVPIAPTDRRPAPSTGSRPRADFLAQLIATSSRAPQTRARCRAEPAAASAAYGALCRRRAPSGRTLSRSL